MSKSLRIGGAGVNATIPLCPYCNKPKNEVVLTGLAGETLAKKLGHSDGKMPMYAHIPGDLEPCDDCREHKVVVFEAAEEGDHIPTGRYVVLDKEEWLAILKEPEKGKDCFRVGECLRGCSTICSVRSNAFYHGRAAHIGFESQAAFSNHS